MTGRVIRRLPVETGVSGWEAVGARHGPLRELEDDTTADWLIIGGGFAGLSAARRLTQLRPRDRIVLLEANEIALGAAGRNSGYMIDVPHDLSSGEYSVADAQTTKREIAENRAAIAFAAAAAAECGMSRETFDPSGKTNAAATERGATLNRNYGRSLARIGEPFEVLDAAQMREMTGTNYYLDGLATPGSVMIQPADYIRALAAGLADKIAIFEHAPALELARSGTNWRVKSRRGSVEAPKVIIGVNGHIEEFGHFRRRLIHIFTYASMTEAFAQNEFGSQATGRPRWALLPADPMGATVRKVSANGLSRIAIRTRFTYDPSLRVSERRVEAISAEQRRSFDARFPALAKVPFEFRWAGRLCLSRNHAPAFGEVEDGLYSACCENGLGTVKSTLAGMMAAELAAGTPSEQLDAYRNKPKPNLVPPEPFAWLGINSVIRWQELRAGREA